MIRSNLTLALVWAALCPVGAGTALAEMPAPSALEAAGATFPFVEAGEGEPVLFVHGSVADYRAWAAVWDDVARDHRAIAYSQRWFGTGDWPADKPFSRDVHTADLVALLQAWGEPMNVVAWSYGGPIALRAAAEAPELLRSLVLYEPAMPEILSGPEGDAANEAFSGLWDDTAAAIDALDYEEGVRESIEAAFGLEEGGFATLDPAAQTMLLENAPTLPTDWNATAGAPLLCDELKTVSAPMLLIVGSETHAAWELTAKAVAVCAPNAEVAVIEGVGHGGPMQARDAFLKLTLDFIDSR